jgi:ABC-type multidrug transport system ATPase subunit
MIFVLYVLGVSSAETRALSVLSRLGFSPETARDIPTKALSGGWAVRAALGAAMFVSPDLLLLDEVRKDTCDVVCLSICLSVGGERESQK